MELNDELALQASMAAFILGSLSTISAALLLPKPYRRLLALPIGWMLSMSIMFVGAYILVRSVVFALLSQFATAKNIQPMLIVGCLSSFVLLLLIDTIRNRMRSSELDAGQRTEEGSLLQLFAVITVCALVFAYCDFVPRFMEQATVEQMSRDKAKSIQKKIGLTDFWVLNGKIEREDHSRAGDVIRLHFEAWLQVKKSDVQPLMDSYDWVKSSEDFSDMPNFDAKSGLTSTQFINNRLANWTDARISFQPSSGLLFMRLVRESQSQPMLLEGFPK